MYRTEDNYEFSFFNEVSQDGISELNKVWKQLELDGHHFLSSFPTQFTEGESDFQFMAESTCHDFKKVLFALHRAFGDYDVTIVFSGDAGLTMEVRATFREGVVEFSQENFEGHGEVPTNTNCIVEGNFEYKGDIDSDVKNFVGSLSPTGSSTKTEPVEHSSSTIGGEREDVLNALKTGTISLEEVDDGLKADRDVVMTAVKEVGDELEFADDSLKADREVVLTAVKNSGGALEFADDSLKADREVVLAATNDAGFAFEYADDSLKADREVALVVLKDNPWLIDYLSEELQQDEEFRKIAEE